MLKIISKILFFLFISPNILFASSLHMIGEKGKLSDVNRIIEIKMYDNYYEPNNFNIQKGETVKFIVHNYGNFVHEFNIATKKMHIEHQSEMAKMVENQILLPDKIDKKKMKELAKTDHAMSHSHDNSILLEPNKSGELIWKFNTNTMLEAACNIPGHYESGMIAKINKS
tara:strand:+ start:333 stop:842 length:510 start_codon:yes stop_codon:yes gene_type:complete